MNRSAGVVLGLWRPSKGFLATVAVAVVVLTPVTNSEVGAVHPVVFTGKKVVDPGYEKRWLVGTVTSGWRSVASSLIQEVAPHSKQSAIGALERVDSWRLAYEAGSKIVGGSAAVDSGRPVTLLEVVDPKSPAGEAGLRTGEVVLAVNGKKSVSPITLIPLERAGWPLKITVQNTQGVDENLILTARRDPVLAPYGLWLQGSVAADPAFAPLNPNYEGGSAGLITALAGIDARSVGDFSAGQLVAGTGALDSAGSVIEVGRVEEKIVAARRSGAKVFFMPKANFNKGLAALAGSGMRIVTVGDVRDAVEWLCAHGAVAAGVCRR